MKSSVHGLLVVDKPRGVTSRDVVDRVLRWFPRGTRLGHAGTLDPLATGVLVVCAGVATRLVEYVQHMDKTYRAGLLLGARSNTDDADGTIEPVTVTQAPDRATLVQHLQGFLGVIEQVPPAFSAAHVTGRRAYDLARRGQAVALSPRRVRIDRIDLLTYDYPRTELEVRCGKGTYIRSLARDLGERLGCGGLVETLRRTRVGPFDEAAAVALDAEVATARARLLPLSAAVRDLPRVTLSAAGAALLRHGRSLPLAEVSLPADLEAETFEAAAFDPDGTLVGVAEVDQGRGLLRPVKVLPG